MKMILKGILALGLAVTAGTAIACPAGTICADDPATVVKGLTDAGYRAKLGKDDTGDPMIESAAAGYNYTVFFYGCTKNEKCNSLQFRATFSADDAHTPALVNSWNLEKRFSQLAVRTDKSLMFNYDVTTAGGLTPANFADAVDWWQTMLGELGRFLTAAEKPAA